MNPTRQYEAPTLNKIHSMPSSWAAGDRGWVGLEEKQLILALMAAPTVLQFHSTEAAESSAAL